MSRPFDIQLPPEQGYRRRGLFAIELLDPVTLERVSDGVKVTGEGLAGKPYVNSSGMFVWLDEDVNKLTKLSIDPKVQPYDKVDLAPADLTLPPARPPVTTIELPPRVDYPLPAGATAARGTLIEEQVVPPVPVEGAFVHLRWLDDDGVTWRDARPLSRTNPRGDFVAVLRLASTDVPHLDVARRLTVRLHVRRGSDKRESVDLQLPQGRVADPSTLSALIVAWDDLRP
jgi:hypothetical protein